MKKTCAVLVMVVCGLGVLGHAQEPDSTTLTQVGQVAPNFHVETLKGDAFDLHDLTGKVVWINFFATWCPPCKAEMPELEKQIWQRYQEEEFTVISIGREHTAEELVPFKEDKGLSFPMAPDPERKIYGLYATQFIPRNVLIDKEGKIAYQSRGYTPEEFEVLVEKLEELLRK